MTTTTTVTAAGMTWRVHRSDPGTTNSVPLLLLHGGGVDSAGLSYGAVLDRLTGTGEVIAPDLPGYGGTDRPAADVACTIEWYVDCVRRLMDRMELDVVDLGGLSLGGGIALGLAISTPERVRHLMLFAPYGLTRRIPTKRLALFLMRHQRVNDMAARLAFSSPSLARASLRGLIRNRAQLTDDLVTSVLTEAHADGAGDAWRRFQESEIGASGLRTCYVDRLAEIPHPTLILTGAQDKLVPVADCERAANLMPNATIEVLDPCAHWIGRDQPEQFVHLVNAFRDTQHSEMTR